MKPVLFSFLAASTLVLTGAMARADVAPPETEPCLAKSAGTACMFGRPGTCLDSTCSKLDYLHWNRDASASPPTMTYSCIKCVTSTDSSTSSSTDTSTDSSTSSSTDTSTDSSTSSSTDTSTDSSTSSSTDTSTDSSTSSSTDTSTDDDPAPADDSGCSVAGRSAARKIAPWLLAGSFSLLFLFARRRRR